MAMVQGLTWGKPKIPDLEPEMVISKEEASGFNSRWSGKTRNYNEQISDDKYWENYEQLENIKTIKKQKEEIKKFKQALKIQSQNLRCVQRADPQLILIPDFEYTISMIITTPETHYERLKANTPLTTSLGEKTVTKPIPTPSRSYLLSTLKTLVLAPLMVIGAMPETNEIEISIWGGANRPYISPNSSEIITFTVESCELQILNAQMIVAPNLSMFQYFISRFRFTTIFIIAVLLEAITLLLLAVCGLIYLNYNWTSPTPDLNEPEKIIEDIKETSSTESSEKRNLRHRGRSHSNASENVSDSWSEVNDSE